jgi:hypothetical protein
MGWEEVSQKKGSILRGLERRAKENHKGYPGKFIWRKISMEIGICTFMRKKGSIQGRKHRKIGGSTSHECGTGRNLYRNIALMIT